MCYCRCKQCGYNTTHTSGFHAAWKRDTGTFDLPDEHDYWKLSGNTDNVTTGTGAYEGGRANTIYQLNLDISEVVSFHQGDTSDAIFSSFLTDFSKVLDNLK